jgi:1,4-dihydroxy-2-naphthoyl-CoA hydrolase
MPFVQKPSKDQLQALLPDVLVSSGVAKVSLDDAETAVEADFVVSKANTQPHGILHGGVSCMVAETLGSIGANLVLDDSKKVAVGQSLHASHIRPAVMGESLHAKTWPLHLGRKSQVWMTHITDSKDRLIAHVSLTVAVIDKP